MWTPPTIIDIDEDDVRRRLDSLASRSQVKTALTQAKSAIAKLENSLWNEYVASINSLADEILSRILVDAATQEGKPESSTRGPHMGPWMTTWIQRIEISVVCAHWRRIALSTPAFWSEMWLLAGHRALADILPRWEARPRNIILPLHRHEADEWADVIARGADTDFDAKRIGTLKVEGGDAEIKLEEGVQMIFPDGVAPALHTFVFLGRKSYRSLPSTGDLLSISTPILHSLVLLGCEVKWEDLNLCKKAGSDFGFNHLHTLNLSHLLPPPPSDVLNGIIASSVTLMHLRIEEAAPLDFEPNFTWERSELQRICLIGEPEPHLKLLCRLLSFPMSNAPQIICRTLKPSRDPINISTTPTAVAGCIAKLLEQLPLDPDRKAKIGEESWGGFWVVVGPNVEGLGTDKYESRKLNIDLDVDVKISALPLTYPRNINSMSSIIQAFRSSELRALAISPDVDLTEEEWRTFFQGLPNLEVLELDFSAADISVVDFMSALVIYEGSEDDVDDDDESQEHSIEDSDEEDVADQEASINDDNSEDSEEQGEDPEGDGVCDDEEETREDRIDNDEETQKDDIDDDMELQQDSNEDDQGTLDVLLLKLRSLTILHSVINHPEDHNSTGGSVLTAVVDVVRTRYEYGIALDSVTFKEIPGLSRKEVTALAKRMRDIDIPTEFKFASQRDRYWQVTPRPHEEEPW